MIVPDYLRAIIERLNRVHGTNDMPPLRLVVTERIGERETQILVQKLRLHLDVKEPSLLSRKHADPSALPQFVQLIGAFAPWLVLFYAAKVFLKEYFGTLGARVAHGTFDGLAALLRKDQVKPLADVATALADTRKANSENVEIVIALAIPDPYLGTAMTISANSEPEEIAYALAVFVTRANEFSATMKAEVEAGRGPLGGAGDRYSRERWRSNSAAAQR